MAQIDDIKISEERYLWAIHRNGDTLDSFKKKHPKSNLPQWITKEKKPTIKQLEDFAQSVNLPFGYLFLENIPNESLPFPMFRGNANKTDRLDINVYDMVNIVQRRQDWLEDYLQENDVERCKLVASITLDTPISTAVSLLRTELSLEDQRWAFALQQDAAVNRLTELLECAGIFITYNGIVGNNTHRPIKVSECRGFSLANPYAPCIFINSQDAKTAQLFTLIHETAHIMLGISAGHADEDAESTDRMEVYCDKVAAEFLVPENLLREVWNNRIKDTARKFKVSELVIARRAFDLQLINRDRFFAFLNEYNHRDIVPISRTSGGSFYRTSVKRIGRTFAMHVRNAVNNSQISYTEAYRLTGLYGNTYKSFMERI